MSRHRQLKLRTAKGFSLLEVVVAIGVVTIGLGGLAALVANSINAGANSKYASLASTLASEKLEDLERWPTTDPNVTVTNGVSAGSLTADTGPISVTGADGQTYEVNYFDQVRVSMGGGSFAETITGLNGSGNETYSTLTIGPQGGLPTLSTSTSAPTTPVTFDRRWLIELNPTINSVTVNNVRRITVWVQSDSDAIQPQITFQMSAVRP